MTQEEINKAAKERFPFPDGKIDFKIALRRSDFKDGAKMAAEQVFAKEDMIDFCKWFNSDLWEYEYRDEETYSEDQALEIWLKERKKK